MIYLGFSIRNPWWRGRFDPGWFKHWNIAHTTKHVELQLMKTDHLISLTFDLHMWRDHAGFQLFVGLLGREFSIIFYDERHHDTKRPEPVIWSNYSI